MESEDQVMTIRAVALKPFAEWQPPNGQEIRHALSLAGYSQTAFGNMIDRTGRTVRRWVAEDKDIDYPSWCVLCVAAGLGQIWDSEKK